MGSGKDSATSSKKADIKPKATSKKVSIQCFGLCKFCTLLFILFVTTANNSLVYFIIVTVYKTCGSLNHFYL